MHGLTARFAQGKRLKEDFGIGLAVAAGAFLSASEFQQAAELFRQSIELREDLLRSDPQDANARIDLSTSLSRLGSI